MARIRSVHPSICSSEDMVDVPAEVERTFVRLWTHCDDYGRAKDNPRLIKAALYPLLDDMTAAVVDEHLDELAKRELIVRYEVDGVRYLSIPSWSKWQHPQKKRDSDIPEPPDTSPVEVRERYGPVVEVVVGEVEVVGEGEGAPAPSPSATPVSDPLAGFEEFWGTYPMRNGKRIGRGLCENRWRKLSQQDRTAAFVGATNYATACRRGLQIAKDPDRWLRDRLWEDWQDGPGAADHRKRDNNPSTLSTLNALHDREAG